MLSLLWVNRIPNYNVRRHLPLHAHSKRSCDLNVGTKQREKYMNNTGNPATGLGQKMSLPAAGVKTNGIITKHVPIRQFRFLIVLSFVVFWTVQININMACFIGMPGMTCFCHTTRTIIFLLTNTSLNRFGIGMLIVRLAMFHWLYLGYIWWWVSVVTDISVCFQPR